ncbi:FAD-dependent oxidoreductase [Bradyrhizobium sp. Cham227]|nr:FAD-dependent oxidoreductase [Bradyrhizobium brasilense]
MLIVGGSYAACEVASQARASGYDEDIIIVSEELELPYHRPPLSKTYLKSPSEPVMLLKTAAFYSSNNIELELGTKVVSIDPGANKALLSSGVQIAFDTLALTVGARARRLSCAGADAENVCYLRSIADARLLSAAVANAEKIVVIGGGFIGLEVASALIQQQKQVVVIEAENRVLARAVSPEISEFLSSVHLGHGLKLLTSRAVRSLVGENHVVRTILLDDGTSIDADIVIVGIGSVPNLELAQLLGLHTKDGIVVNSQSRTSRTNVFAAGDCTRFSSPFNPNGTRIESVQNATDQARVAGAVIAGKGKAYEALPWFWSDQYDLKLQIAGVAVGATERIVRSATSGTSVFHFRDDACVCVESVNRPREHISARLLLAREVIMKRHLQDVDFDIPALLKERELETGGGRMLASITRS